MTTAVLPVVLTTVLFSMIANDAEAQVRDHWGTEFFLAFGANSGGEHGTEQENLVSLDVVSRTSAIVIVEIPAIPFSKEVVVSPDTPVQILLPDGNNGSLTCLMRTSEEIGKGMAVHVRASEEVSIVAFNHKLYSSDAFLVFPVDALGTHHRVLSYTASSVGQGAVLPAQFLVVGIENFTEVTIQPASQTERGIAGGSTFKITLDRGDAYQVQGASIPGNDLTGSFVLSSKPVAVFGGHQRTEIPKGTLLHNGGFPSRDHLVEQIPPIDSWGKTHVVVPLSTAQKPELVRVLSHTDNNQISIGDATATIHAGQYYEIGEVPTATRITSTAPVLVGQYAHTSWGSLNDPVFEAYGDPSFTLIAPIEQWGKNYVTVTPAHSSFDAHFLNIVTEGISPNIRLDGTAIEDSIFHEVSGSSFTYARLQITPGVHRLESDHPFGVTSYGFGRINSYSTMAGSEFQSLNSLGVSHSQQVASDDLLVKETAGNIEVTFDAPASGSGEVKLYNVLGSLAHKHSLGSVRKGTNVVQLDGLKLNPGCYFIEIAVDGLNLQIFHKLILH